VPHFIHVELQFEIAARGIATASAISLSEVNTSWITSRASTHDAPANMSTVQRRSGKPLRLDLRRSVTEEGPAISALFLVKFDVKAGYRPITQEAVNVRRTNRASGIQLHGSDVYLGVSLSIPYGYP
jgi:hypothetical protein